MNTLFHVFQIFLLTLFFQIYFFFLLFIYIFHNFFKYLLILLYNQFKVFFTIFSPSFILFTGGKIGSLLTFCLILIKQNPKMKKNQLWKTLNRQSKDKCTQQPQYHYLSPQYSNSHIDQVFKDIPTINLNKKIQIVKKISEEDDYDPATKDFIKELEMAVEEVEDMEISCESQQNNSRRMEDVEQSSSIRPGVIELRNIPPQLDNWQIQSPTLFHSTNRSKHSLKEIQIHSHLIVETSLKVIQKLSIEISKLQEEHFLLKDSIQAFLNSFRFSMETIFSKERAQEMKVVMEMCMRQSVEKSEYSIKNKLNAQKNAELKVLQNQIQKLEEEVLSTALDRTNFQQVCMKLRQQNEQLIENNFSLQQEISQKDIYVEERIQQLIQQGRLKICFESEDYSQEFSKSDEQNYQRRILQYEEEIEKLSNLVDQLGRTYQREVKEKQEELEEEKERVLEGFKKIEEKQEQLRIREQELEEIVDSIEQNRIALKKENELIQGKKQEVKEMDSFLKAKMEEMEVLQRELNEGYLQLDMIIKQQQDLQQKKSDEQTERNNGISASFKNGFSGYSSIPRQDMTPQFQNIAVQSQYFTHNLPSDRPQSEREERKKLGQSYKQEDAFTELRKNKERIAAIHSSMWESNYNKDPEEESHLKAIERDLEYVKKKLHQKQSASFNYSEGQNFYYHQKQLGSKEINNIRPQRFVSEGNEIIMNYQDRRIQPTSDHAIFMRSAVNQTSHPLNFPSYQNQNNNHNLINYSKLHINFGQNQNNPSSNNLPFNYALKNRKRSKSNSPPSHLNLPQKTTRLRTESTFYPSKNKKYSPSNRNCNGGNNLQTMRDKEHPQITKSTIQRIKARNRLPSTTQHAFTDTKLKEMGSKIDNLRKQLRQETKYNKF